ncbi:LLM class flavin-dependent oxidoreductase [Frankia tisae]|uniref:LLM class flavin-dependent oxidoreductase n=1 Tax=Frankia tisae TaxID=2950104 RepID=UPI0021C05515|nr:LLM class flavin-dependent oxidoreductase [Frankia tisae]
MKISCAFGPAEQTPDDIVAAESLGYDRAWVYDSPAVYLDPWATLAVAATRTSRIGLGTAVVSPGLRHPLVTASAIATLESLAPGRVSIGVGAGASARWLLGQKPARWAEVEQYIVALRGLVRGEEVEWEGKALRMLHPTGWGPARPIDVPLLVGAEGPRGLAVARRHGDGVTTFVHTAPREFDWVMRLVFGTVLQDGESVDSDRVFDAVGAIAALGYHATYEWQGQEAVRSLPEGERWLDAVARLPAGTRHLALHAGHGVVVNDIDRDIVPRHMAAASTWVGTADDISRHIEELCAAGVTEVTYQPGGKDIVGELERFAEVAAEHRGRAETGSPR